KGEPACTTSGERATDDGTAPPPRSRLATQGICLMTEEMPSVGMQTESVKRLLTLKQAARAIPIGRGGKPQNTSNMIRWILDGVLLRDGTRLRLQALRAPGGWLLAQEWVYEFLEARTRDRLGDVDLDGGRGAHRAVAAMPPLAHRRRTAAERRAAS